MREPGKIEIPTDIIYFLNYFLEPFKHVMKYSLKLTCPVQEVEPEDQIFEQPLWEFRFIKVEGRIYKIRQK